MAVKKVVNKKVVKEVIKKEKIGEDEVAGCVVIYKDKKIGVESIWASAGMTISTADYESARFDFGAKLKPIEKDTDLDLLTEVVWDMVKNEVSSQARAVKEELKNRNKVKP